MDNEANQPLSERDLLVEAQSKGPFGKLMTYTRLSGPGWLQSAITLGGGSLAGSLYLGVIGGYELLWLQPLMMILGVVMLSAIGYVALSTGERPFGVINKHVNPVLGWGWIIATLMANLVWAMPQFSLGTAALQQNLLPGRLTGDMGTGVENMGTYVAVGSLFLIAAIVVWFYDSGGWGIKLFDILLKIMVGIVVLSFFGVVIAMTLSSEGLDWSAIGQGFIPNFAMLFTPSESFQEILKATTAPDYWEDKILSTQRDRMVTAAATAVGINMTFLLPYSMLKRGWDRVYRGMATFDLSTGLFVPFLVATSCVVIASATQFHGKYDPGLLDKEQETASTEGLRGGYLGNLQGVAAHHGFNKDGALDKDQVAAKLLDTNDESVINRADREVAAMLVRRDSSVLANSLEGLTGKTVAQNVFGVGVLGMAISTIIILMLINGFTICEMLRLEPRGILYFLGCLLPGITGSLGFIFLWGDKKAKFLLAEPTSVFGMVLLPVAYITFFFLMNNKRVLGDAMPRGLTRFGVNLIMLVALAAATVGASWSIWGRTQLIPGTEIMVRWVGIGAVVVFLGLALLAHFLRSPQADSK